MAVIWVCRSGGELFEDLCRRLFLEYQVRCIQWLDLKQGKIIMMQRFCRMVHLCSLSRIEDGCVPIYRKIE